MTDRSGNPPPYSEPSKGFSGQYGADFGGAYTTQGNAYPPQTGAYPPQGGAYPAQPGHGYSQHSTTAVVVTQPGYAGQVVAMPRPPDYMAASIFACLCCFWPTGLCAIYYASQASKLAAEGDMAGATSMSNSARNLMISSIVIGVIWITLVIVLRAVVYSNTYNKYDY
ncbi:proline-rich transmembrane protein 1-like isoform X2 [Mercenaria mercenaria]|uniref:proline-rich transmembrane protein 1-like isoform X2 n=1 Tax=Mercenaria mercenaria TaxID=6596 RepID=UPI001E1D6F7C|nr:proline-rich transmembrane protein 1-like isoform X2 [Mercenaria mercenaria]